MYEYPFGNGQQLNLDWFLAEWKNLLAAWEAEKNGIDGALQAEIDRAEAALADVFAARDAAAQSAANALESKNAAAQSASDASGYLATVRADASTASNAARNAAQSESNAANSAQTALASKNAAAQSAADADARKSAAAQSAADALASKDAAAQSAADALANKDAAAQSASDAEDAAASVVASAEQIATNTSDIANLKNSITTITSKLNDKAPIITNNESGEVINIKDGANNIPVKSIRVIDAESAIITRCGKNLCSGLSAGYWDINTGNFVAGGANWKATQKIKCKPNTQYSISRPSPLGGVTLFWLKDGTITTQSNGTDLTERTYTTPANCEYLAAYFSAVGSNDLQLEIGAPSSYEAYTGTEFNYPTDEITTLYGVNNIWSNSGDIDITYYADTKLYIDNKIAQLQATILENIGG